MKAQFEKVASQDVGWHFLLRELTQIPFEWHFHPEYELTFTIDCTGERYVGDHISPFSDRDLVLLGPNLPHTWHSKPSDHQQTVFVLWFSQRWIDGVIQQFPEYQAIQTILNAARRGIVFPTLASEKMEQLFSSLKFAEPRQQLLVLLSVLDTLMASPYDKLASAHFDSVQINHHQQSALSRVLDWMHQGFHEPLSLAEAAQRANMSISTFVRFFKRSMRQTFNQYLNEIRIGHACSLLIASDKPISVIVHESGFSNQSYFNRAFKKYKTCSPLEFRKRFRTT